MGVSAGGTIPEFSYTVASGETRLLSSLWAEKPAVILWLRHFG